jgi:anti-sigma regulatory factor (Ser/Thr protein kinase)
MQKQSGAANRLPRFGRHCGHRIGRLSGSRSPTETSAEVLPLGVCVGSGVWFRSRGILVGVPGDPKRCEFPATVAVMGEADRSGAVTVVLCAGCGDVVLSTAECPTCGRPGPPAAGSDAPEVLDEGLLDRVGAALAAQAALARRTATERVAVASRLYEEAVVLERRLRRQRVLLRSRAAARKELMPEVTDALRRVEGALESAVVSVPAGWTMSAHLPRDRTCSAVARRLLEDYGRQELCDEECENAMLICSELVTNAFLHGQGAIVLRVSRIDDVLRIEVRDEGRPDRIDVVPEAQRGGQGRGLWIVEQLASDWGAVEKSGLVWAELALGGAVAGGG